MASNDLDELARRFEEHRRQLKSVAYRVLGSLSEADDAVQEAWIRLSRTDAATIDNLGAWLTTVVGRICLNVLRARTARREDVLDFAASPDPVISYEDSADPEREAELADSVGLALMVVLGTLSPAERLSFVLHDMFAVPFEEIAPVLGKTPAATRQLASRARRRVQGHAPVPDPDLGRQREVVSAYFAAVRDGDFERLLTILHPDVVIRSTGGPARPALNVMLSGARTVAGQAVLFGQFAPHARAALINGAAGVVVVANGRPVATMAFVVTDGLIVAIDVLADPARLTQLGVG
nr:sigma-70 family RNA polymerase sigma factor [Longispora albida]